MLKKLLVLACFSIASMNVSADVLRKDDVARFQAMTGLSQIEAQALIDEASRYVCTLYEMGYSDKEIDTMINQKVGAVAKQSQDVYDGYIRTRTMWILLAATVVVSSSIASFMAVGGYIGAKIGSEFR